MGILFRDKGYRIVHAASNGIQQAVDFLVNLVVHFRCLGAEFPSAVGHLLGAVAQGYYPVVQFHGTVV